MKGWCMDWKVNDNNMKSFKWMMNRSKTFESLELDSKWDCNLSLSRNLNSNCSYSLSRPKITYP